MVLRLRRAVSLLGNHSSSSSSSSRSRSSSSSISSFLQRRSSSTAAASYLGSPQTQALAEGVLNGHRLSLSRAITLIESTRESHRQEAEALLDHVVRERSRRAAAAAMTNNNKPGSRRHNSCSSSTTTTTSTNDEASSPTKTDKTSRPLRIGIAGPPGAGKSTFIEALGKHLLENKGLVSFTFRSDGEGSVSPQNADTHKHK